MKPSPNESFVTFPRKIASMVRSGKLSQSEFRVYSWLRCNANPWGISTVNYEALNQDVFAGEKKEKNTLNKILLSLKKKRLLHYEDRNGRRGSFDVVFADFLLPTKKFSTYEGISRQKEITGSAEGREEVGHGSDSQNQSLEDSESAWW